MPTLGILISASSAILVWGKRKTPGAVPLFMWLLVSFFWEIVIASARFTTDLGVYITLKKMEVISMASIAVLFLIFALEYTRQDQLLIRRNVLILWIIPWLASILAVTNEQHLFLWNNYSLNPQTGNFELATTFLMDFFIGYYYLLRAAGSLILIWAGFRYPQIYRRQFWILLACAFVPWVGNIIYFNDGWYSFVASIPLHPIGYTLTGAIFSLGILRYGLFDVIPLARDSILEFLDNGIVVLNNSGQIIDANKIAQQMLSPGRDIIRLDFEQVFREATGQAFEIPANNRAEIILERESRIFLEIKTHSIKNNRQQVRGMLITLHDFTDRKNAQMELQAERDFAMLVMNNMGQGLTVTNDKLIFEYVNPAYARMLGYKPQELLGRSPLEFTVNKDTLINSLERRQRGEVSTYQSLLRNADGSEVYAHITGVPRIRDGQIFGAIAVITDMTEIKKAEEELRHSRAQLTAIFENVGTGIWVSDIRYRFTFVNSYLANLLGFLPEELIGQDVVSVVHPYDAITSTIQFEGLLNREYESYEMEKRYRRKDGSIFWGALSARPIYNAQNEIESVVGFISDITQRKQAEEALRETERRFREILENIGLITVMLDQDANITFCNEHFLNLTGWTRTEVLGRNWIGTFEAGDAAVRNQYVRAIQRGAILKHHENRIATRNGEKRLVSWANIILRDEKAQITGMASIGEDITARRNAENSEREQRELAEALIDSSSAISTTLKFAETIEKILENVIKVVPHDAANIALFNKNKIQFVRARGYETFNISNETIQNLDITFKDAPAFKNIIKTQQPIVVSDTEKDPKWVKIEPTSNIRSNISSPIIVDNKVVGVINLDSTTPGFFNEQHARRLHAFSLQAAIAFKNARLYEEVDQELQKRKKIQSSLRRANKRLQTQLAEIEALQAQLRQQAIRDPLTGLFNRRFLEETLAREISRAERDSLPVSIMMIDIDHFKSINDTYGHEAGDLILKQLGKLLSTETRRADAACRFGGEEFCVVMSGAPLPIAVQRAEALRSKFAAIKVDYGNKTIQATISLGISCYPEHGLNGQEVVKSADNALYRAKRNGRNRIETAIPVI
jgi:diguanylate cyclase (GGDEF)-like protein/PAS domain S-box-containing protein